MKFYYPLTILVFFFYSTTSISQKVIYVDSSATGRENGTSWINAYKNLDSANTQIGAVVTGGFSGI
jgi:hypothetical protein